MSRTLLQGGCVLSLDRKVGNFHQADVLIDGDRISEIGPDLRARDAEVVDATDTIVMPGFVDAHRHVLESLFRGLGDAKTVSHSGYAPDDVYAATLIGLFGAAEAGITTVVDWFDLTVGEHTDAVVQAHADAGLRTVLVHPDPPTPDPISPLTTLAAGGDNPGVCASTPTPAPEPTTWIAAYWPRCSHPT
jgi:cytosine/adenosine deaminase-related metal-dependent hydrolase